MSDIIEAGTTGELFVAGRRLTTDERFQGVNPATGEALPVSFSVAGPSEVEVACRAAAEAFEAIRALPAERRAELLKGIADALNERGERLIERAGQETGLPAPRLTGELARTVGQLRLFASEVRAGGWMGLRIDPALPDRKPMPRPDLRMRMIGLGPVAVFGASNFPLAFSVAGGDTASALAAGCPVVVKGHPAHPGTSAIAAEAIEAAVRACGFPAGTFSLLNGTGNALGEALVADPRIKAVGFTGSRAGGLALMRIAANRPVPIPVYAEMSSINPVLLLPGALASRADDLARDFVASVTLGAGQFCTNPGLVLAIEGPGLDRFVTRAAELVAGAPAAVMLSDRILSSYEQGVERLERSGVASLLARGDGSGNCGRAALFSVQAQDFLAHRETAEEVFGASSLVVRCRDDDELEAVVRGLEGQLTTTVHFEESDEASVARLLPALETLAGRVIANGWPTGVEVSHAMVHGGPFPATSDGRSTSVGTLAIERFLRPVCYQNLPDSLLPPPLRDGAQQGLPHRLDGAFRAG